MSEIFYAHTTPIKTNHPGDFQQYLSAIQQKIRAGEFCGSIEGYWWIVPLQHRLSN